MISRTIDRVLSKLIIDPCVRSGRVPGNGPIRDWFGRLSASRIIRVSRNHPLYNILKHDDWITSYSISSHTLMWLWNYLRRAQPSAILEMGSGMSTLVFALYAAQYKGASAPLIISFDHDRGWLEQTVDRLKSLGLQQYVELRRVDIGSLNLNTPFDKVIGYCIDPSIVSDLIGSPELVLIDGPPSTIGRIGTFPSIVPILKRNATILLDDAQREAEKSAIRQWLENSNDRLVCKCTYPLGKGLARMDYFPNEK